jgi:EAL domain-containing protein (putative c-di-GMP-specific phosphodiesterase class I)
MSSTTQASPRRNWYWNYPRTLSSTSSPRQPPRLEHLRRLGVRLLLDDVRAGATSLLRLAISSLDGYKNDATLIHGISSETVPASTRCGIVIARVPAAEVELIESAV